METAEKTLTPEQKQLLDEIYDECDIDMEYEVKNNMPDDVDDFMEVCEERINEIEVIYYNNAMEYLAEWDTSLQESLGIAHDMGYTVDNLNSELLATLLKQQNAREKIYDYRDNIEELFYNAE